MRWRDLVLGLGMCFIATYNLNHPIYDRLWFHRTSGRATPRWTDAGPVSRAARLWLSALITVGGVLLVRFAIWG